MHNHIIHVVTSFVELTKYVYSLDGVKLFLSEWLNQDPLESFFGKQRQRGGGSDNPTVSQFINSTSSLRAQGSLSLPVQRGNTRRKQRLTDKDILDTTPLPKRKRSKWQ